MHGIPSWRDLLLSATTSQQVIALANEYLARLDPSDAFYLPQRCKPREIATASDLNAYAIDLKTWHCSDHREAELMDRISGFFQEAATRLAQLTGPHRPLTQPLWESTGKG